MIRLISILLALFLLTGCTVHAPDPTTQPTTEPTTAPTTQPTDPPGASIYMPDSNLEVVTDGAVKCYELNAGDTAVYSVGDKILVFSTGEQTDIRIYTGEELWLNKVITLEASVAPENRGVQISEQGMSYYDSQARQIVLLDENFTEKKRFTLPENAKGVPAVDEQQTKAYFCTENEIRSMDLTTGIAALLRQETGVWQSVYDVCFDGKVLLCDVIDRDHNPYLAYFNTENGKLMDKDNGGWDMTSYGDAFLMLRNDESGDSALYGTWDTEPVNFVPVGEAVSIQSLLPLGGAVAVHQTAEGTVLDYYTLESGFRTASLQLPAQTQVQSFTADVTGNCVWFLLSNTTDRSNMLCRWDISKSAVEDDVLYYLPRYTELAPDVEGLNQLKAEAEAMGAVHGMDIRIWKDAIKAPWSDLKSDFRVSSFRVTMDALNGVLDQFPAEMIAKLAPLSDTGATSVSIVRGEEEPARSYFKWLDGSIYIAVTTGEKVEAAFCNALYRAMDIYILNSNSILDEWDAADPVSDRATLFQYAMAPDQAEYFADEYAQLKLKQLCKAIRYAFDLREYEGELLWEQYLSE